MPNTLLPAYLPTYLPTYLLIYLPTYLIGGLVIASWYRIISQISGKMGELPNECM